MFGWLFSLVRRLFCKILRALGVIKEKQKSEITLRIHIKTADGKSLLLELNPKWDILRVKQFVAPKIGLDADEFSIIFAGKELPIDLQLEECDLGQHSFLHAIKLKVFFHSSIYYLRNIQLCSFEWQVVVKQDRQGNILENKPMCETLLDLQLTEQEKQALRESEGK